MLYRVLMRLIESGQTDGLEEKIEIFYAIGKLTNEEFAELMSALSIEIPEDEEE